MTAAQLPVKRAANRPFTIVPRGGLAHSQNRKELAWIRAHASRHYFILISSKHIEHRITELAREIIRETCQNSKNVINFLIVLKGAAFFGCRLAQEIFRAGGPDVIIHFVSASSYGNAKHSSGRCRVTGKLNMLRGRDVIVIDDICDTGLTLDRIKQRLKKEHAASVKTCVLMDKPGHRLTRLKKTPADFIGFQIPTVFVAGFGLEYVEKYRELPFVIATRNKLKE
jgi:hypoxanthine phosphoribosyltransferase